MVAVKMAVWALSAQAVIMGQIALIVTRASSSMTLIFSVIIHVSLRAMDSAAMVVRVHRPAGALSVLTALIVVLEILTREILHSALITVVLVEMAPVMTARQALRLASANLARIAPIVERVSLTPMTLLTVGIHAVMTEMDTAMMEVRGQRRASVSLALIALTVALGSTQTLSLNPKRRSPAQSIQIACHMRCVN